jgi:hypothetical protein
MLSTVNKYNAWCKTNTLEKSFINHNTVAGFLIEHVNRNEGSTRSVDLLIGYLKRHAKLQDIAWLSSTEEYKLKLVVSELKYQDVRGVVRKHPLKLEYLLHVMQKIDIKSSKELYGMTLLFLGHDGLLRSGELASGLTTADVSWGVDMKSFTLQLKRSKGNRKDGAEYVTYADRDNWSAVKLLRIYYDKFSLWHQHDTQLFSKMNRNGSLDYSHRLVTDWIRRYVKKCVVLIG